MTVYTENFNKADNAAVGAQLTFTDTVGDIQNLGNLARCIATTSSRSRAEHDTAGADQYGQVVVGVVTPTSSACHIGVCLRYAAAADTCYLLRNARTSVPGDTLEICSVVAGVITILASATITAVTGDLIRFEVSGSTLTGFQNGTQRVTVTDTAITTGTRGGIQVRAASSATRDGTYVDNLEFGDLAAAAPITWAYSQRIGT